MYTSSELKTRTVQDLKILANIYHIEYPSKIRKADLIDLILEHLWVPTNPIDKEQEETKKSARVLLIESNKNKEL